MKANFPAPIFIVAPPVPAALLVQVLGRTEDIAVPDGWFGELLTSHCGDRARLTAADATPEVIAAIREKVETLAADKRLLDASPLNLLRIPFLHAVFPEAAFVWIFREAVRAVYDPRESSTLSPADRARDWSVAMAALLDDLEKLPARVWTTVPYRLVAQYPDQAINLIASFLDVTWDGVLPPHRDEPIPTRDQMPDVTSVEEITSSVSTRARQLFGKSTMQARSRGRSAPVNEEAQAMVFRSIISNSFGELLRSLGVSLVVSTYQSGCVILICAEEDGPVSTHFRMFRSPMGIAVRSGEMVLGTKTELWEFRNVPWVARQVEPVGKYDACFLPRKIHVTGDIRIHEIGFAAGELWLINTRFSALCTLDGESSFVPRWHPPFVSRFAAEDRCHLNGMAIIDDRIRYVSALGATDTAGGWRANKGEGVLVDVDSGEIVLRNLSMPHSPRQHDGRFFILESGRGTIATADLASGRVETIAELPGFTRGLAFAGPFAFIGLSQVRESNVFGGIPLTDRVEEKECGIYVVDVRNGATVGYLRFEGNVHEIFDIQVLPGIRYPHLADLTDKLVTSAFAVPDHALAEFA